MNFAVLISTLLAAATLSHHGQVYADLGATHDSLVSEYASFNTPGVVDGRVEAIAIDGDTVYVGGTFTQIHNPLDEGNVINQPYLFAYSKSTGDIIQSFDPQLNNSVLALETTGDPAGGIFAGGVFGNLNGAFSRGRFAKIDINGDHVNGFGARVDAAVTSMVRLNDTLYIGGNFGTISSTPIERLAALDTTTGAVSPNLNLDFGGLITTSRIDASEAVQGVDDMDITTDGQVLIIVGNFESINGISRTRLALIELAGQASVSDWNTDVFDVQCPASIFPQYIRGIDISPDDTYLVTGTTGYRITGNPACDSIVRFEIDDLTNTDVQPTWVNYTGGDSVYEVVATEHAIYTGGHFRWLNNYGSSSTARPGSVARDGMAALDPLNGLTLLDWQSDRNPRGRGTFALIAEDEGLYIGDDTDFLNGTEHRKLKFLPISSNVISRPEAPSLPTSIITPNGNNLDGINFDGSTFGTQATLNNSDWSDTRGGVFVGGRLFHADSLGRMWSSVFADGAFQARTLVNLLGLDDSRWNIDQMGGMFFNYEQGRLYYTIRNDSRLFWRAFTPASPYFGERAYIADDQGDISWGDVSGMDVVDGYLYFSRTNASLYRAQIQSATIISGTTEPISGPGIDTRNWDNNLLAFLSDGMLVTGNVAEFEFESSGSDTVNRFQRFEFPVAAGEEVILRLQWDDPGADLALFVRDANNQSIALDNSAAGSPKWLTVPAGVGGTYTASVLIREGSTPFNLQVNPIEAPPEPLADFEFTSSGSDTTGRWQVFSFEVNAGELIEGEVIWDDPTADVRIFLRDESGTPIVNDTDGGLPAMVSAIAESSGTWSIGVRIVSGTLNYDVLVNTTTDFTPPDPLADFEFTSSGSDTSGSWQVFRFDVTAGETVDGTVTWDDPNADVRIFLRDENGSPIVNDTDGGLPAMVSAVAGSSGTWSIAVRIVSGTLNYDVLVNTN
ncbi:MAG: hypothetical protein V3U65_13875 [Granulosicoccaceae bacterium]